MKSFICVLLLVCSSISFAKNTNYCQEKAEKKAYQFIANILNETNHVDQKLKSSVRSYKVVKNPRYNLQMHENYTFDIKTIYSENSEKGMQYFINIQMFANQLDPGDEFSCYIEKFELVSQEEGVKF